MAKAVLTTKVDPTYDDLPEVRYHFPRTYPRVADTVGRLINTDGNLLLQRRPELIPNPNDSFGFGMSRH